MFFGVSHREGGERVRESEREGVNIIPFSIAIAIASYSQLAS